MLQKLILVLGGAASGKSLWAETLVENSSETRLYIATAQNFGDAELGAKISAHRARRGAGWATVESPVALAEALAEAAPDSAVLIDCATLWLTNLLLAEADLGAAETALFAALDSCPARRVVVVSNEVGQGVVPESALGRRFREAQGGLNQRLAARADAVVAVMAGLPLALKGEIPR